MQNMQRLHFLSGGEKVKYRKKPVIIDAIQFEDDTDVFDELQRLGLDPVRVSYADRDNPKIRIETLEGEMIGNIGDYIIKGVNGEFYPCKEDIFNKTYEKV